MKLSTRFYQAFSNLIACAALIIGSALLICKGAEHIDIYLQEKVFVIASLIISFLSGFLGFGLRGGIKEDPQQRKLVWWTGVIVFYLATSMLCQRLHLGTADGGFLRNFGLSLFLLGGFLRLWAIATLGHLHSGYVAIQDKHALIESGPYRFLRHPSYSSILIMFISMPLIFGAWFPLLAVPGIFVTLKWRINAEEALLSQHFGDKYDKFKKGKWKLIPFVY